MKHLRKTARRIGSPIVSVVALGAAACGSSEDARDTNPFRAQTYDEVIGTTSQAVEATDAAGPPMGDGGPVPDTDAGTAGAGGSAGKGGAPPGGTGGGPIGFGGGPAGAGGGPLGAGGGAGSGSGSCGNGIAEDSEQCDGKDLRGETCESATLGARPNGFLGCSPGCVFDVSNCTAAGTGGSGGGGFDAGPPPPKGGSGGMAGAGGMGGQPGQPSAFWMFDDCSAVTRTLLDSSGNGIHAQRTVSAECAAGIQGQANEFNETGDRGEALNAPQFALDQRVAVAAWVRPNRVDDNRPVVLKRLNNKTAFSLRIQKGEAQFEIV